MQSDDQRWAAANVIDRMGLFFTINQEAQVRYSREFVEAIKDQGFNFDAKAFVKRLESLPEDVRLNVAESALERVFNVPVKRWALLEVLPRLTEEEQVERVREVFARMGVNGRLWLFVDVPDRIAVHPAIRNYGRPADLLKKAANLLDTTESTMALDVLFDFRKKFHELVDRGRAESYTQRVLRAAMKLDQGSNLWRLGEPEDLRAGIVIGAIIESIKLDEDHPCFSDQDSALVSLCVKLYQTSRKEPGCFDNAAEFYDRLEDVVSDRADRSDDPVSLGLLLSPCVVFEPLRHCEARLAPELSENKGKLRNQQRVAWCSRLAGGAGLRGRKDNRANTETHPKTKWQPAYETITCNCAHVLPLAKTWTLVEALAESGLPDAPGLEGTGEYATWLAGYINRLNEIRPLMKCDECGKRMLMVRDYARKMAVYRATVGQCPGGHGRRVYFNHCWNCGEIIDSRRSTVSINPKGIGAPYVCLSCGAGPYKKPEFIGTVCPCGCGNQMRRLDDGFFVCPEGHRVDPKPKVGVRGMKTAFGVDGAACDAADAAYEKRALSSDP